MFFIATSLGACGRFENRQLLGCGHILLFKNKHADARRSQRQR
jgi:hypothetical protein